VERGTARGAGRFGGTITIAGKTGTAQNPHGPAHGWFIGFAPADKPEIVVGAIVEFAREGPYVAPLVTRVIGHYLGVDTTIASHIAGLVRLFPLATGTGGGTAASEKSWITIAGVRLGQPAELAKLAVILMLARWLAERREPPTTLRDLVYPCVIVGVPVALVV